MRRGKLPDSIIDFLTTPHSSYCSLYIYFFVFFFLLLLSITLKSLIHTLFSIEEFFPLKFDDSHSHFFAQNICFKHKYECTENLKK